MTDPLQPGWLAEAWSLFGIVEGAGSRNNPRIIAMYRDAGHPDVRADSVAWCAAFVGACLKRSGVDATGSLMARSYLRWGALIDQPRIGAVAVYPRGDNPALGHVGFVVGMTDDHLLLLSGNQDNAVTVTPYSRQTLLALRWPSNEPDEPLSQPAPQMFELLLEHIFEMEGGYSDDPHDPGGPTNLGITLATYAGWRHITVTAETFADLKSELRALDRATAAAIYRARYWAPSSAEMLPTPLALMHFDASVNHGVGGAIRILQQACDVTIDGEIGPETLGAANSLPLAALISTYANIRITRYRALPHFWRFGRGWLNRVAKTRTAALLQLRNHANPPQQKDNDMTTMPSEVPPKWWGSSVSIWGTIITALSTVLPVLAPLFGLDITGQMVLDLGQSVTTLIQAMAGVLGTAMAIYGRARAVQPLTRRPVSMRL